MGPRVVLEQVVKAIRELSHGAIDVGEVTTTSRVLMAVVFRGSGIGMVYGACSLRLRRRKRMEGAREGGERRGSGRARMFVRRENQTYMPWCWTGLMSDRRSGSSYGHERVHRHVQGASGCCKDRLMAIDVVYCAW